MSKAIIPPYDALNPKPLHLVNVNNKLLCNVFVEINLAPKETFSSKHELQPYLLPNGAIVRLVNVIEVKFEHLLECYTLPANGMKVGEFWRWWLNGRPETTEETMMGVYYYERIKE